MRISQLIAAVVLGAAFVGSQAASAGTITYYHNDLLGSPIAATNPSRQVIWRENYRPYGERVTKDAASADNKVWYTSRRQDAETGLVYMGARYYDPAVGRFMGPDLRQFDEAGGHSFNRYAYANNNPYRFSDPNGLWAEDVAIGIPSLVLGAASLKSNMQEGRYGAATFDGIGMVADALATAIPGVPGGAGLAIAAARKLEAQAAETVASAGANKIKHIFGNPEHKLDGLVQAAGSKEKAFEALQQAATQAYKEGRLTPNAHGILPGGTGGAILDVGGISVQMVGGRIINGEVKIGSMSRKALDE